MKPLSIQPDEKAEDLLLTVDVPGLSSEPEISTLILSADSTVPSVSASAAVASIQDNRPTGVTASSFVLLIVSILAQSSSFNQAGHELQVSTSVSALATNDLARLDDNCNQSPSLFNNALHPNLGSTQSEQNPSVSYLGCVGCAFADADSVFWLESLRKCPECSHY